MDPNAAVTAWLDAPNREANAAYNAWRARGGFAATVEIAAHADLFMRGERWATVERMGDKYATVKGNRSGRTFRLTRDAIARVVGEY